MTAAPHRSPSVRGRSLNRRLQVRFGSVLHVVVDGVVLERVLDLLQLLLVDIDDRLTVRRGADAGDRRGEEFDVAGADIAHIEGGGRDVFRVETGVVVHVLEGDHLTFLVLYQDRLSGFWRI